MLGETDSSYERDFRLFEIVNWGELSYLIYFGRYSEKMGRGARTYYSPSHTLKTQHASIFPDRE